MDEAATIFALSSGRPPAAIAVVRVSGARAGDALRLLIGRVPQPRRAALAAVRDPASGEVIDEALALWFPGPHSETGEDTAELHLHGGRAVVAAVLSALGGIDGLRPAEAGEFTRRAFANGRIELTRVEGLADLVAAETEAQRRQAMRQMRGVLGDRAEAWRARLTEAMALIAAQIDFPDEGDVPTDLLAPARTLAAALKAEIDAALADGGRGERLREGLVVAIAGPPNAGKSSLLNRLVRRDAAIVSPFAGTTRDVIEVHLDLAGCPVMLLDTAGVRDSDDPVEQEGIRRARERAATADLVLWVVDAAEGNEPSLPKSGGPVWRVRNKSDLLAPAADGAAGKDDKSESGLSFIADRSFAISAKTGVGLPALAAALADFARDHLGSTEPALVTRARQRRHLADAAAALGRALAPELAGTEDLVAEELRLAARALGRLTGRVDVEDVLDVIFRDFCIGK